MTRVCTCSPSPFPSIWHRPPSSIIVLPLPPPSIPTQLRAAHYTSTFHSIHRFLSIRLRLPLLLLLLFQPCNPESGDQADPRPPPCRCSEAGKGWRAIRGGRDLLRPAIVRTFRVARLSLDFSSQPSGLFFRPCPIRFLPPEKAPRGPR